MFYIAYCTNVVLRVRFFSLYIDAAYNFIIFKMITREDES